MVADIVKGNKADKVKGNKGVKARTRGHQTGSGERPVALSLLRMSKIGELKSLFVLARASRNDRPDLELERLGFRGNQWE